MNFDDLSAYVRSYLDQDTDTLPDVIMQQLVLAVESSLNMALRDHPRMRSRQGWTVQGGVDTIPLPSRLLALRTVMRDGELYEQYPPNMEAQAQCNPPSFIALGDCIHVFPTPSTDSAFTLDMALGLDSLVSTAVPPTTTDTNWVSDLFPAVYQAGTMHEACGYLRDPASQQQWKATFFDLVAELQKQGWNEQFTLSQSVRMK